VATFFGPLLHAGHVDLGMEIVGAQPCGAAAGTLGLCLPLLVDRVRDAHEQFREIVLCSQCRC